MRRIEDTPRIERRQSMTLQMESARTTSDAAQEAPVVIVGYDGSRESDAVLAMAAERAGPTGTVVAVHATPGAPEWRGDLLRLKADAEARAAARRVSAGVARADVGPAAVETSLLV